MWGPRVSALVRQLRAVEAAAFTAGGAARDAIDEAAHRGDAAASDARVAELVARARKAGDRLRAALDAIGAGAAGGVPS